MSATNLRAQLIAAGLARIEAVGAARLTLREVAARAGVSHMGPYSHFRDKGELLSAIAAAGFLRLRRSLRAAAMRHRDPARQFLATGLAYVAFAHRSPQLVTLMFGGIIPARQQSRVLQEARGQAFADIVGIVHGAQRAGHLRGQHPEIAALAGWAMAHGFCQLALGGEVQAKLRKRGSRQALATAVLEVVVAGLQAPAVR
jgi:AcrR family transcriptional regulator